MLLILKSISTFEIDLTAACAFQFFPLLGFISSEVMHNEHWSWSFIPAALRHKNPQAPRTADKMD